jgi:phosphoribosylamine--glycine ligase
MKVLVIGSGGREHNLVWKIRQNPEVKEIYCIPGNGGIETLAECHTLSAGDFKTLVKFAKEKEIDFTVVGPERPLVEGIVDYFRGEKLPIFGPSKSAAQTEGSKVFAKRLMAKYHIPTARYEEFDNSAAAFDYIKGLPEQPLVVKADGLAAGKGSVVCPDKASALEAVDSMMNQKIFREAGAQIVIEECMTGEEVSIFVITDGKDYISLTPAQDFKRALNNDRGKNTGGMGSYTPAPFLTDTIRERATREIVEPTLAALQSEGIDYTGVLYIGLMLTPEGPRVVEFNCRFGDPETQVVMPLLRSDLLEIMQAVHHKKLGSLASNFRSASPTDTEFAVCVVLASGGYPDAYESGKEISGLDDVPEDILVFHAGTRREDRKILTSGGRVLGITATASRLPEAARKVYDAITKIHFDKMHFRSDISKRAWKMADG